MHRHLHNMVAEMNLKYCTILQTSAISTHFLSDTRARDVWAHPLGLQGCHIPHLCCQLLRVGWRLGALKVQNEHTALGCDYNVALVQIAMQDACLMDVGQGPLEILIQNLVCMRIPVPGPALQERTILAEDRLCKHTGK